MKSDSASAFGLESSGTVSWAPICYRIGDFMDTVQPGLLEDVAVAVRQNLWFQQNGAGSVERDISGKVEVEFNCMASSVAGSNSDEYLSVRTPEGALLCSPFQDCRRSRGKTSSCCDKSRCQHVKVYSGECLAVHCRLPCFTIR
jgi:hypothetical protein